MRELSGNEEAKVSAQKRWVRPASFYLLFATPLVLLLSLRLMMLAERPSHLAFVLALLFLFSGIVLLRALMDLFEIACRQLHDKGEVWRQTLGEADFVASLQRHIEASRHERDAE